MVSGIRPKHFFSDSAGDELYDHLDWDDTFDMCVDTFGGYEEFAKYDLGILPFDFAGFL